MRTLHILWLTLVCLSVTRIAPGADAPGAPTAKEDNGALASQVKEIFRSRCLECHGPINPSAGIKVLDRELLIRRKKLVPGKPDASILYQSLIVKDETAMPKGQPPLSAEEIAAVRRWIVQGAPAFPADAAVPAEPNREQAFKDVVGVDYVLKKILAHVRNTPRPDRRFLRYFSINHILTAGATPAELELQRDALAKAINHLTWEGQIVKLKPITPTNTIFAIDLRQLGWHLQPYGRSRDGKSLGESALNLFDLVLLEYPYGISYRDSETFDGLVEEFLEPAGQVRPIPYVRADWFVSTATQPTLYEDLLRLPFDIKDLEKRLQVDPEKNLQSGVARRAGMTVSKVSRNNRVVERHPLPGSCGAYWKSFDFKSSKGIENMIKDPIHLNPTGGEFIFTLPNGLQGYFVSDAQGRRLELAPTDIVTDKFAEDKTVRNGLSCMRCHDAGMKAFTDTVRPALKRLPGAPGFDKQAALDLYPEDEDMQKLVAKDGASFLKAMQEVLGKEQNREPLIPVSQRFLDKPLQLNTVAGELGLAQTTGLEDAFKLPQFSALGLATLAAQGVIRRDSWEDSYDQVVRLQGLGTPLPPLDGVARRDYPAGPVPFEVELKTNKPNNLFQPGDRAFVFVVNQSQKPLYIELICTSTRGEKVIPVRSDTVVKPGQTFQFPPKGEEGILIQPQLGKEQITLFASDVEFPSGELLRGTGVTDRVVHAFHGLERKAGRLKVTGDLTRLVKKTIEIETR